MSSNKIIREKVLQSKPTGISVFPKVPMPGDPLGADGSLQTFQSCSKSLLPVSFLKTHCSHSSGVWHFFSTVYPGQSCSSEKMRTPAMLRLPCFPKPHLLGSMAHQTHKCYNKHTANIQLQPLPYRWNTSIMNFQPITKTLVIKSDN